MSKFLLRLSTAVIAAFCSFSLLLPINAMAQQSAQNRQLQLLKEALNKPKNESSQDFQKRMDNSVVRDWQKEDAERARRENEYQQSLQRRLGGQRNSAGSSVNHGPTSDYNAYQNNRNRRLNRAEPKLDIPVQGTSSSGQRRAGFDPKYNSGASGYSSSNPSPDYGEDIDSFSRKNERIKDATPPPSKTGAVAREREYCACKRGDKLEFTGIMCIDYSNNFSYYDQGYYPMRSDCPKVVRK